MAPKKQVVKQEEQPNAEVKEVKEEQVKEEEKQQPEVKEEDKKEVRDEEKVEQKEEKKEEEKKEEPKEEHKLELNDLVKQQIQEAKKQKDAEKQQKKQQITEQKQVQQTKQQKNIRPAITITRQQQTTVVVIKGLPRVNSHDVQVLIRNQVNMNVQVQPRKNNVWLAMFQNQGKANQLCQKLNGQLCNQNHQILSVYVSTRHN